MGTLVFYIFFGICFICFAIRTSHHVLKNRGSELAENRKVIKILFVVMFFLWFGWHGMVFNDPYEMNLTSWLRYIGLAIFIIGISLFIIPHLKIKGVENQDRGLITGGIYSKLRHPMYFGFMLWIIGFSIFMDSLFTIASSVIWIPQFLYWGISEEKELEKKYEEYGEYKRKTWF